MLLEQSLIDKLKQDFPNVVRLNVSADGDRALIEIVDAQFTGLPAVKCQQLVYKSIMPWISDKSLHAVSIRAFGAEQ